MSNTICPKCQHIVVEATTRPVRHLHVPRHLIILWLVATIMVEFLTLFVGVLISSDLMDVYGKYIIILVFILSIIILIRLAYKYSLPRTLYKYVCQSCKHTWHVLSNPEMTSTKS
jgi:hypothetical protein